MSDESDLEDDLDEVVSATDKQIWFQKDVVNFMNTSLKDPGVYNCLIGELDQIRQAHSHRPAALNKEVVRTMFHLPFRVNFTINGDLEVYGVIFRELLEKYDPLLRCMNKNKEAQLTGVDHVTTPFLELIRNDKLSAADWSTRKVRPVLDALKNHYIIEEVRIKEAMADIEQGIEEIVHQRNVQHMELDQQREAERRSLMTLVTDSETASVSVSTSTPSVVPADSQQGPEDMEVKLVGVLKPQPDREDCAILERERHKQQSLLTSEQLNGKFEILLKEDSGSELEVKPVHEHEDVNSNVKINTINTNCEPAEIHTSQLHKPSCKVDFASQIDGKLRSFLCGHMYKKDGKYIAEVEVYLQFCRTAHSMQEQIENFRSWRTDSGWEYLDMQTFPTSPDLLKPDDKLIIEFCFCDEDKGKWVLREESENQVYEAIPLKSKVSCLAVMTDDPISIAKYAFSSTSSVTFPLVATLKVKIMHEPPHDSHGISSRIKIPRVFGQPYDEEDAQAQAPALVSKQELTEQKMMAIARRICPEHLCELAIALGMLYVDYAKIKHDNQDNSCRQSFIVLHTWYGGLLEPKTNAIKQLAVALRSTSNGDAAKVLKSNDNC